MAGSNPFPIMVNDCELFEQDLFPNEFEYFCKHIQAFRSMWLEKSLDDKIDFIEEFFHYSENYGYIRDFPLKVMGKKKYFNGAKEFLIENFAKAKVSAAKSIIQKIALIASNKDKILQFGGVGKAKDPFYMKETRDTFRTFFGEPSHPDTLRKTVANMPLYTRFSGSICRVLRRWVEGFSVRPEFARSRNSSAKGNEEKESHDKKSSSKRKVSSELGLASGGSTSPESDSIPKSDGGGAEIDTEKNDNGGETDTVSVKEKVTEVGMGIAGSSEQGIEDTIKEDERTDSLKVSKTRHHHCSYCHEIEREPKLYKKCAWCKGKGTRFYCSKICQNEDWLRRHKKYHIDRGTQ